MLMLIGSQAYADTEAVWGAFHGLAQMEKEDPGVGIYQLTRAGMSADGARSLVLHAEQVIIREQQLSSDFARAICNDADELRHAPWKLAQRFDANDAAYAEFKQKAVAGDLRSLLNAADLAKFRTWLKENVGHEFTQTDSAGSLIRNGTIPAEVAIERTCRRAAS